MTKVKRHVYRVGDEVTIVEPLVVLRVGYKLGIVEGVKHIEAHAIEVNALLAKLGISDADPACGGLLESFHGVHDDRVLSALAYAWIRAQRFGGPERTIHTETRESLRGKRAYVQSKRVVKTGTYQHGHYGEDGGDPPYLADVHGHVLLELNGGDLSWAESYRDGRFIEIEACHVQPYVLSSAVEETITHDA